MKLKWILELLLRLSKVAPQEAALVAVEAAMAAGATLVDAMTPDATHATPTVIHVDQWDLEAMV